MSQQQRPTDDFDIIAFNGITGDCLTTKENPPKPELNPDQMEEIRQQHEAFLTKLEALAVSAIATNDWNDFYRHLIEFQSELQVLHIEDYRNSKASADELDTRSADPDQTTDKTIVKD